MEIMSECVRDAAPTSNYVQSFPLAPNAHRYSIATRFVGTDTVSCSRPTLSRLQRLRRASAVHALAPAQAGPVSSQNVARTK
jgi:hypothetical protein